MLSLTTIVNVEVNLTTYLQVKFDLATYLQVYVQLYICKQQWFYR